MTTTVTIDIDGETFNVDAELFREYRQRAFDELTNKNEADAKFKEEVETLAETTGIKKGLLSKYLKASHAAKTKALKAEVDSFEALDNVVAARGVQA